MWFNPRPFATLVCALALWLPPADARAQSGAQPAPEGGQEGSNSSGAAGEQKPPAGAEPALPDDGPKPAGVGSSAPAAGAQDPTATEGVAAAPAAQDASPGLYSGRPFSGLFGGAAPPGSRRDRLDVSGSVYAARAFYPSAPSTDPTTGLPPPESTYSGGTGSITYGHGWTHGSVSADGTVSEAYVPEYKDIGEPWVTRWNVGGGGAYSRALSKRVSVNVSGTVGYSPYLQQNLFANGPATVVPPIGAPYLDYVLARLPSVSTSGTTRLNFAINNRSSLEAFYSANYRHFTEDDQPSQYDQYGGARYHYRFNQYVGFRAGYAYRYARYGFEDALPQVSHLLDVGLEGGYGRSYALSRRTTFSFNTGSSIYGSDEVRQDVPGGDGFNPKARFNLDASADLLHAWARTWSFRTGYRRGTGYEVGFNEPLFYDSAFATVGGLLAERLDFTANSYYTTGTVGFTGQDNGYSSGSATASLRYAIGRHVAAYAQYFYYRQFYDSGVTLPYYLLRTLERQGVTVGLTAWVPLISPRGRP